MQLPRGRFREIVRGVPLSPLLSELHDVQYTGVVSLTWDSSSCTLVLQNGTPVLAEYPPMAGDRAWEALLGIGDRAVSGILSDLNEMQMKLVAEFNPLCLLSPPEVPGKGYGEARKVVVSPVPEPLPRKQAQAPPPATGGVPRKPDPGTVPRKPEFPPAPEAARVRRPMAFPIPPKGQPGRIAPPGSHPAPAGTPPGTPRTGKVAAWQQGGQPEGGAPREAEPTHGSFDPVMLANMEMSALDEMDVDHIASKIRKNARGIVKKLHLGHLMTEKDE